MHSLYGWIATRESLNAERKGKSRSQLVNYYDLLDIYGESTAQKGLIGEQFGAKDMA